MLYGKKNQQKQKYLTPIFGSDDEFSDIPKYRIPEDSMEPRIAYRLVKDELEDEGNARQNLATFCQTYMEDEAVKLITETLEKNAIDKSEYPRTTELENRCVNMLAKLWNVPKDCEYLGTSTVGSSEGCMLAGLAMKFRWRKWAKEHGIKEDRKANLVISSGYQVCWEKFCTYWDIEMREVPMNENCYKLDIDHVLDYVDEYTIGIVGIMGLTYNGLYDDIKGLDEVVSKYNNEHDDQLVIHVDGASGGMYAPFVQPDLVWDFRLDNVVSINTSGHKYGLVYPGIGWVLWKDKKYVDEELIFNVSYLGGSLPTMAINFSRSASQIVAQYYNFIRYGNKGYTSIHMRTKKVANYIAKEINKTGYFHFISDGNDLPILCYEKIKDTDWDLYDLSDHLRMRGWQVPTYPMSKNLDNMIVQRIVCRSDFGMNVAVEFIEDFNDSIDELNKDKEKVVRKGFTH